MPCVGVGAAIGGGLVFVGAESTSRPAAGNVCHRILLKSNTPRRELPKAEQSAPAHLERLRVEPRVGVEQHDGRAAGHLQQLTQEALKRPPAGSEGMTRQALPSQILAAAQLQRARSAVLHYHINIESLPHQSTAAVKRKRSTTVSPPRAVVHQRLLAVVVVDGVLHKYDVGVRGHVAPEARAHVGAGRACPTGLQATPVSGFNPSACSYDACTHTRASTAPAHLRHVRKEVGQAHRPCVRCPTRQPMRQQPPLHNAQAAVSAPRKPQLSPTWHCAIVDSHVDALLAVTPHQPRLQAVDPRVSQVIIGARTRADAGTQHRHRQPLPCTPAGG